MEDGYTRVAGRVGKRSDQIAVRGTIFDFVAVVPCALSFPWEELPVDASIWPMLFRVSEAPSESSVAHDECCLIGRRPD